MDDCEGDLKSFHFDGRLYSFELECTDEELSQMEEERQTMEAKVERQQHNVCD